VSSPPFLLVLPNENCETLFRCFALQDRGGGLTVVDPTRQGRRGRQPDPDPRTPSGYRITDRRRFELSMAQPFVGKFSLQDVIDVAVSEFLEGLYSVEGFRTALHSAEKSQRDRSGVPSIRSPEDEGPNPDNPGPQAG
jgi:hypothetical protein